MRLSGAAPYANPDALSFEAKQQGYYTQELNRALPTRGTRPDTNTIQLALGTSPSAAREAGEFVSDFGARTSAIQRDAECRSIPYPGTAMRAADARVGCGWWYSPSPSVPSIGAYGTRRGPMSPTLDTQVGPGQWIWDPQQAYQLEGIKAANAVQSCSDLQFARNPQIGWCPSTNRAVMTDGNGNPAFPQSPGGDCPGGGIIMSAASCPPGTGTGTGGLTALCQPTNGVLGAPCLQAVAGSFCSPNGSLAQALSSGYAGQSSSFNDTNKYLLDRGFTIHSGIIKDGRVSVQDSITSVLAVRKEANAGDGSRMSEAAMNLCFGTPFNPCAVNPSDVGPFDANCITQTALGMGYDPKGTILPANKGMDGWNKFKSWNDVVTALSYYKNLADNGSSTEQATAIEYVYGTKVKFPKQGCNITGIMLYRYFCPSADAVLFPTQGPQTHFLGRYLLKNGFPSQSVSSQEMTPAGGVLTESQRMVANFYPTVGGNYQFMIVSDDMVRVQVAGEVIGYQVTGQSQLTTQIIPMVAGQPYELTVDLGNSGSQWSFTIAVSHDGSSWAPISPQQLMLPADHRLPMIDLAFHKMPAGTSGSIADTNGVLQNLQIVNSSIGQLNGKNCLLVNGPRSGVFNNLNFLQGIRIRAMKSITLMVCINTVVYPTGTTPSLFAFYNLPDSNTTAYPRKSLGTQPYTYGQRTTDFIMTANTAAIFPFGINPNISGISTPYTMGQWVHIGFVWKDDFTGYTLYMNGAPVTPYTLTTPPYDIQVMVENLCIGCDNHPEGQNWTGGIAWFRAFDYPLTKESVARDMKDAWSSL